jgi:hypothetical protein
MIVNGACDVALSTFTVIESCISGLPNRACLPGPWEKINVTMATAEMEEKEVRPSSPNAQVGC